ncbi:MAG: type IV toxin-antitoxin system AbiEi family antitoxin domain-containing protein [Acidimicrobiales bacterium]
MVRAPTVSRLAAIAEDQWGFVTRRQAERAGVSAATLDRITGGDGILERVAHGVYHLAGAPLPDHVALRAAWLQLEPNTLAWERRPDQGVVSHRSAGALYGLGHLPADSHDFTLPQRRQSRRPDVRLHRRRLRDSEWAVLHGLPVTRPPRIAADLLGDREDPEAVAHVVADAIRDAHDYPGDFADALAAYAARFGLRRGDGLALLRWLLDLTGDPEAGRWVAEAHTRVAGGTGSQESAR